MSEFTSGNLPGMQAKQESGEVQVWWSGRHGQDLIASRPATIDAAAVDAGNVPTTTLRGGQVMASVDASGKALPYKADANDGRQMALGILEKHQSMLVDGVATDRVVQLLVHGLLKESELVGLDPRAKQQLASRFVFDRDLAASGGVLMHPRGIYRKSANYAVSAADNGLLFLATAAVTFTLPTKQNGLAYRFGQLADADLIVAGSGGDVVHRGNASASAVVFSTTGQKIGSQVLVECVYTADGVLKWLVTNLGGTTVVVA